MPSPVGINIRRFALFALLLSATACTKNSVEVSSLGDKLIAPELKVNPFDQDIDSLGYVEVAGTCSEISGTLYVSMDGDNWYGVPETTTYTFGGVTGTKANDTDCSDNKFDFFLTIDLVSAWAGRTITKNDVTQLYFRTEGVMGESEKLVVTDGSGTPHPNSINLVLSKDYPSGSAGSNQCEQIIAGLYDDQDHAVSVSTPTPFSILKNGTTTLTYPSYKDCADGSGGVSSEDIPAGQSSVRTYVRFSGTGSVSMSIATTQPDILYSGTALNFSLRTPASQKFIAFEDAPFRFYKQKCYPIAMKMHHYDGSDYSASLDFDVTSSSSDLKFYGDSSCSTEQTTFTVSSSTGLIIYARYNSSVTSSDFPAFKMTASPSVVSGVDPTTRRIEIDQSANATVTQYSWRGPKSIPTGKCHPYDLSSENANGTSLPMTAAKTFTLAVTSSSGNFYSDSNCSSATPSLYLTTGAYQKRIYFKPTTSTAGVYNISAINGSDTPTYSLSVAPTFEDVVISGTWNTGSCQAFYLNFVDGIYSPFQLTTVEQFTIQTTGPSFYTDNICSMGATNTRVLTTTIGDQSVLVGYIKVSGVGTLQINSLRRSFGATGYSAP